MHRNFYQIGKAKRKYREENEGAYTKPRIFIYFPIQKHPILQNSEESLQSPIHQVTELNPKPVTQSTGADLIALVSKRLGEVKKGILTGHSPHSQPTLPTHYPPAPESCNTPLKGPTTPPPLSSSDLAPLCFPLAL